MTVLRCASLAILMSVSAAQSLCAQTDSSFKNISLNDLAAFNKPGKNWVIGADATADLSKPREISVVSGQGTLVNMPGKPDQSDLYTRSEFGDVQVEFDFMMPLHSNSGVYLMGKYELQLSDSWMHSHPTAADAGGVMYRNDASRGDYEGTPPLMNVGRAPGLWQHVSLKFRAPKFDAGGKKMTNARFDEVYLNGVLVQQMTSVTGPTAQVNGNDEKVKGPLMFQGKQGPVAIRNIRYRELGPEADSVAISEDDQQWNEASPILLNPVGRPRLLRSFMNFRGRKLTHIISIGDPSQINFSYDLKSGAMFQLWRGEFLDVTRMWHERGEPQLAAPLGAVIRLTDAPAVAKLPGANDAWPDSTTFDAFLTQGYNLDKNHFPSFHYRWNGMNVSDSFSLLNNGQGLQRQISIAGDAANAYVRIAADPVIDSPNGDLYPINGKSYYIRIDKRFKPFIRQTQKGKELVVKYDTADPVTYSIIW